LSVEQFEATAQDFCCHPEMRSANILSCVHLSVCFVWDLTSECLTNKLHLGVHVSLSTSS